MRFHSLECTSLRNSRCTFLYRGFAQSYHIFRLRLPLNSHRLYYAANVNAVSFALPYVATASELAETKKALLSICVVRFRCVAGDKVAKDASAPSTILLSAAAARESSKKLNVLAETFSDLIMLKNGVSVGVISEIHCVHLSSLNLGRLSSAICRHIDQTILSPYC